MSKHNQGTKVKMVKAIPLLLFLATISLGISIDLKSTTLNLLSQFDSGIHTCFSRVFQSYIALTINDMSSDYLKQNFQNATEECFVEGQNEVESLSKGESFVSSYKRLDTLMSNVHWLHEEMQSYANTASMLDTTKTSKKKSAFTSTTATNNEGKSEADSIDKITERFSSIETDKDEILEKNNKLKQALVSKVANEKNVITGLLVTLVLFMIGEIISAFRKIAQINEIELMAESELSEKNIIDNIKIMDLIKEALEFDGFKSTSSLFLRFYTASKSNQNSLKENIEDYKVPRKLDLDREIKEAEAHALKVDVDKIWSKVDEESIHPISFEMEPSFEINKSYGLSVKECSEGAISQLSEIILNNDLDIIDEINSDVLFYTKEKHKESIEECLFYLMSYFVKLSSDIKINADELHAFSVPVLKINGNDWGEQVVLDLKLSIGKNNTWSFTHSSDIDLELEICQALVADLHGKLQIINDSNQSGEVIGKSAKLILSHEKMPEKSKLVDLKRGTKKELMSLLINS